MTCSYYLYLLFEVEIDAESFFFFFTKHYFMIYHDKSKFLFIIFVFYQILDYYFSKLDLIYTSYYIICVYIYIFSYYLFVESYKKNDIIFFL